jgi:hypothetical protein
MPQGNSCANCKFWNQVTTTFVVDPTGVGNAPVQSPGAQPNTNFGQCRAHPPKQFYYPVFSNPYKLLQWALSHMNDNCGEWST